jgi:hypothetical protein
MRIWRFALACAIALSLAGSATAQNIQPYVHAITVGTSSIQVIASNQARKQLVFHNPNDQIRIAVCPLGPSRSAGATVTAAINGAGCITILPYDRVTVSSGSPPGSPQAVEGVAWVGIASSGGAALTILEWE